MAVYNGTSGADNFTGINRGTVYADSYYTGSGNDVIDSYSGDDYISAGDGDDIAYAGDGNDQVYGGAGNDKLFGDLGNDVIYAGFGNDTIWGELGNDQLYGEGGNDIFMTDGVSGIDAYTGGDGSGEIDTIRIDTVASFANWGIIGISYLSGIEKIENVQAAKPVDIEMSGSLNLKNVEVDGIRKIVGSSGNDTITGTSNSYSSSLNDVINAGAGDDSLEGGTGNDQLTGGSGADRFIFAKNNGTDIVTDFNELEGGGEEGDKLQFTGQVGNFVYLGTGAFTGGLDNSEARMVGSEVLVDLDGNGIADITVTLTSLVSATQLAATDFVFV